MRTQIHTYICIITICVISIIGHIPIAYAQSAMSGGGYSLDGGITVFTAVSTGGGSAVANAGDPITIDHASGGSYTLSPSPFNIPAIPSTPTSPQTPVSGYTQHTSQASSNIDTIDTTDSAQGNKTILNPKTLHVGTIWENIGSTTTSSSTSSLRQYPLSGAGTQNSENGTGISGELRYKTYVPLTTDQKKILVLAFVVLAWTRVFKRKTESHMRKTNEMFTMHDVPVYATSKYPISIWIDGIIYLHQNISVKGIPLFSHHIKKITWIIGIIVGNIVLPCLAIGISIWAFDNNPIFTFIFSSIFVLRMIIWYRL